MFTEKTFLQDIDIEPRSEPTELKDLCQHLQEENQRLIYEKEKQNEEIIDLNDEINDLKKKAVLIRKRNQEELANLQDDLLSQGSKFRFPFSQRPKGVEVLTVDFPAIIKRIFPCIRIPQGRIF